jgi:hypothetical protein
MNTRNADLIRLPTCTRRSSFSRRATVCLISPLEALSPRRAPELKGAARPAALARCLTGHQRTDKKWTHQKRHARRLATPWGLSRPGLQGKLCREWSRAYARDAPETSMVGRGRRFESVRGLVEKLRPPARRVCRSLRSASRSARGSRRDQCPLAVHSSSPTRLRPESCLLDSRDLKPADYHRRTRRFGSRRPTAASKCAPLCCSSRLRLG